MMSTEFAEIIPDRFSNPHAPDFINESCHSSYNNTAYYSDTGSCTHSFDTGATHHNLILEYPGSGLLEDHKDSYSCEQNISCIQLLVKEANSIFPGAVDFSGAHINGDHMAGNEDKGVNDSMGGVQVRIQCADGEVETKSKVHKLSHDLLQPTLCPSSSPPSSCGSTDSIGSPTPTPSYGGLASSATLEYPGCEENAFAVRGNEVRGNEVRGNEVRGNEVAGLEERQEPLCDQTSEDEDTRLHDKELHIKSSHDPLPPVPTRRSHLSHLQSPNIHLLIPTYETRKLSDPAVHVRRQKLKTSFEPKRQRCLSDSEAPSFPFTLADDDELKSEECYSALGCDSGFQDERMSRYQENVNPYSSPRVSLYSSDLYSQEDGNELTLAQQKTRRITPHPYINPFSQDSSHSDDQSSGVAISSNPGTMVHPRERSRRSMMKHFSQGSIGGASVGGGSIGGTSSVGASSESPSLSSVLETQSNLTCATDILSSLGFDDFDSHQLVPDRFIPKELEHLKPTSMKAAFIEQILSPDPPRSPDSLTSGHSSSHAAFIPQRSVYISDLPLGATAENFLPGNIRSGSPVNNTSSTTLSEDSTPIIPASPSDSTPLFTDTAAMAAFSRSRVLETVPEETASDLSPSPRWLSPRVSIDHSVLDLAEGKLGASLVQKVRRRSLPTREGYRLSIGSLVESETGGDSIHLSVTSYDDEIAAERERERENLLPGVHDDITIGAGRRRRRGVYTPPQTLLSWLSTQKTIDEEADTDPDELPWPFNEQAHLRKSLTEISLAQQLSLSDNAGTVSQGDSDDSNLVPESSVPDLSLSPATTPNSRLSPQPTLSEIDEDSEPNDLEVEVPNTVEPSNYYHTEIMPPDLSIPDSQSKPPVSSPREIAVTLSTDGEGGIPEDVDTDGETATKSTMLYPHDHHQPHQYHHLIPISTSPRRRKQVVTPFSVRRPVLPSFFGEPMPSDMLHGEVKLPLLPANMTSESNDTVGEELHSVGPVDSTEDLTMVQPADGIVTVSSSEDSAKESPEDSSATTSSISLCSESPARPNRRPRLSTLRQNSSDSLSDGLPEDMSEIELLTGDIHSPVLSSRRTRVPLKKQKSMEESQSGSPVAVGAVATGRSRPNRRVAVIGEAPSANDLFANTTITQNQSEVGKYMVL